jgi:DNA-binding CsgD family transcriptional regulator
MQMSLCSSVAWALPPFERNGSQADSKLDDHDVANHCAHRLGELTYCGLAANSFSNSIRMNSTMTVNERENLILKAIRDLYDAVLNPTVDPKEFSSLCQLVAGRHLIFYTQDLHTDRLQFVTGLGVGSGYFHRLAAAAEARIMPLGLLTMPTATATLAESFWVGRDFDNSAFYNEVVRPDGGHHGLLATPFSKDRYGAFLAIERLRGQQDFDESDKQALQTVLPHLTNSFLIRLKLQEVEYTARSAYHAFDLLDLGVFIVDGELRPFFMNKYAEGLIKEADGLSIYRGKLQTSDAGTARALRGIVKSTIALKEARLHRLPGVEQIADAGRQLDLPRISRRAALTASVMPLGVENDVALMVPPARAIVLVKRPNERPQIDISSLAEILDLTPRQATLTALLAEGATLGQAAASLGLAINTARWHLKEIFEKTDTHRQIDLVRLALQAARRNELS